MDIWHANSGIFFFASLNIGFICSKNFLLAIRFVKQPNIIYFFSNKIGTHT